VTAWKKTLPPRARKTLLIGDAMTILDFVFYLFGSVTCAAALGVITAKNPVHAVLFLVLTFVSASGLFVLLNAEFLAMALIVVYVGAVMVLFLFVVMMLDVKVDPLREGFARYLPLGLLVGGIMAVELMTLLGAKYFGADKFALPAASTVVEQSNTAQIGLMLFRKYALPFEVASLILLVAAIAAVALTLRQRTGVKIQDPAQQVLANKSSRLKIVSMEPTQEVSASEVASTQVAPAGGAKP
jgi:NADH-quinone oxidoreductase subunit J